jgi:DNA-binding transcriptional regulator YiaG
MGIEPNSCRFSLIGNSAAKGLSLLLLRQSVFSRQRRRRQSRIAMKIDKSRIEQFIRDKVEIETLTDAQIARLLNVGTSTVSHWRNKFHIRPANKFKRKFKEKYGSDALDCFDMMVKNRSTLQEIANYFGFSREYARQVYNKLYNGPYSEHQRQRRYR